MNAKHSFKPGDRVQHVSGETGTFRGYSHLDEHIAFYTSDEDGEEVWCDVHNLYPPKASEIEDLKAQLKAAEARVSEIESKAKAWDDLLEEWPGGLDEIESAMRTSKSRMIRLMEADEVIATLKDTLNQCYGRVSDPYAKVLIAISLYKIKDFEELEKGLEG